jgi:hypothetical protein
MSTITILRELISDEATVELKAQNGKFSCELGETSSDYEVKINNIPEDSIVIKSDKFPAPKEIFKGTRSERKRSDYVIVTESKKRMYIIELKRSSDTSTQKDVIAQLKGSDCLMEYCRKIGREFWGDTDFLDDYEKRYIRFVGRSLDKRSTRQKENNENITPEKARIIKHGSWIQYNQL